jgi:hypothetical protein
MWQRTEIMLPGGIVPGDRRGEPALRGRGRRPQVTREDHAQVRLAQRARHPVLLADIEVRRAVRHRRDRRRWEPVDIAPVGPMGGDELGSEGKCQPPLCS